MDVSVEVDNNAICKRLCTARFLGLIDSAYKFDRVYNALVAPGKIMYDIGLLLRSDMSGQ